MTDINPTLTKLNIEADDDKQLIEFGRNIPYNKKHIDWGHWTVFNNINVKSDKHKDIHRIMILILGKRNDNRNAYYETEIN